MSYLREHRRTPDGSRRGRPLLLFKSIHDKGLTTGAIYLGEKEAYMSALEYFDERKEEVARANPGMRLGHTDRDSLVVAKESIPKYDAMLRKQGFVHVDHDRLLNDILAEVLAKNFDTVKTTEHYGHLVERGPRFARSGINFCGSFSEEESAAEWQKWDPEIDKILSKGFLRPKSVVVYLHRARYALGFKNPKAE
jgi:hypothetical protein